ncbi:MAG: A/G-specific adenine glycosylase [Alphaproteobacteria bacterium]
MPASAHPSPRALLAWYDRHRRRLPWRALPGVRPDPYRVWLAEVMLQQTTVAAVIPYYERFLARWPHLADLAAADEAEVLAAWAGLGYYARARRLIKCARAVAERHGGRFPSEEAGLRALPGIGAYSAAAIAAIAFDRPAVVVDGNVERVMARLFAISEPRPKARLRALAGSLAPRRRPGDYAQAVMDLGATVCTPRAPRCGDCPWASPCLARASGAPEDFPVRGAKAPRPVRYGVAFVTRRRDHAILLRRRPPEGLLGGMTEVPSTPWRGRLWTLTEARRHAPARARWRRVGQVEHTFTHFHLVLDVVSAAVESVAPDAGYWRARSALGREALPSVMRKVLALDDGA